MVVPTQSGVRADSCTDQATRPARAGSTRITSRSFAPKNDTSRVPPASPDPVVGVHQEVIASGERSAASTASAGAATVLVHSKSSMSPFGSVAGGRWRGGR